MNTKKHLRDKRDEDIYSDYKRLLYNDIRPNAIYRRLTIAYYLAPSTIERIIIEKRKESRMADERLQPP